MKVLADSAYGTGEFRAALGRRLVTRSVKPAPRPRCRRVHHRRLHRRHAAGTVTCPAGVTRPISASRQRTSVSPAAAARCAPSAPPASTGSSLKIRTPRRAPAGSAPSGTKRLAQRLPPTPADGRTIDRLAHPRQPRVRYRGVAKNNAWLHHRVAALNLRRLLTIGVTHTGTTWAIA